MPTPTKGVVASTTKSRRVKIVEIANITHITITTIVATLFSANAAYSTNITTFVLNCHNVFSRQKCNASTKLLQLPLVPRFDMLNISSYEQLLCKIIKLRGKVNIVKG